MSRPARSGSTGLHPHRIAVRCCDGLASRGVGVPHQRLRPWSRPAALQQASLTVAAVVPSQHKERVQRVSPSVGCVARVKNLRNARPHTHPWPEIYPFRRVQLPASISTTRSELFRIGGGRATSCSKLSGRATLPFRRPGSETQHQRGNFGAALQVLQGIGIEYQKKLAPVPFRSVSFKQSRNPQSI